MLTTNNTMTATTVKRWTVDELKAQFDLCLKWNDPAQWEALATLYYTHGYVLNAQVCFVNAEKAKLSEGGFSTTDPNYEKPVFKAAMSRYLAQPGTFRSARNFAAELLQIARDPKTDPGLKNFCTKMAEFMKLYSQGEPLWAGDES